MRRIILVLSIIVAFVSNSLFGLSGQYLTEFQDFVRQIREEKRVDRIGYLIFIQLPISKTSENKVLSLAGKFFYSCEDGYLTHVNYARLAKIQEFKIPIKILDKKRLDDTSELWYMLWIDNPEQENVVKAKFEPLFRHENTWVIRIRPEDEDFLQENLVRYSIIEETLLPLKSISGKTGKEFPEMEKFIRESIASITGDALASTVQILQDFTSRYVSDPGNQKAVEWLAAEFQKLGGYEVATPTFSTSGGRTLSNVIAIKRGEKEPNTVLIVGGHMDSTSTSWKRRKIAPGADDNGSGTAATLEIARVLAKYKFPYTIIFACWNAEEVGLVGSKAHARTLAGTVGIQIKAVFNMDMIGDKDDNEVAVIGNAKSNWLIDVFKDAASKYVGLKSKTLYNSNIWYSDHSSFWNIGASAILTIEGHPEVSPHYHKSTDLLKNMSVSLMEKVTRSNLAALLTLNPPIIK